MKKLSIGTKRALSGSVTSAMLISAVAIMGVTLVGWSQSTLTSQQQILASQYSDQVNSLNEYAVIENVWFSSSPPNLINYTIVNVGTIGLNVTEIKLLDSSSQATLYTSPTITNGGIFSNQIYSYQDTGYAWTSGEDFTVVVTTARDRVYLTYVVAP